ncbi:glycosyltransferase family 4 protein [Burkholderia diffusa]|uniref:Glycosyl transferase family 1 n=1 Tax=Burkholderia diffusa TaxID=488732 RepID=A0A6P2PX82_9BURK|nr:glycosyltransferase [Burkholderia diffusa]KAB0662106.1 glycosyltransferase [Burkholderia diffusa]MBM2655497.1 glycosyltransferase [Burkholderia diffusa]VWC14690.1 glycosyl transferase family 1 [Burkholderia diffusa]
MSLLKKANKQFLDKDYGAAYRSYQAALVAMPELSNIINFNIELMRRRGCMPDLNRQGDLKKYEVAAGAGVFRKLPINVLVITWDVGHNCLGRSYMLAEVVQKVARHTLLVGFQFPKYGNSIWEPVRAGQLPVVSLPGSNLPDFYDSLERISSRIKPDVVIACKPRLPSVALGMAIKEKWGCPLIIDVDDHELSFFKNQSALNVGELESMPEGSASSITEPYAELWTRLTQSLCDSADEIIVSNVALQNEFGGTIVPHVRDEAKFDPAQYNKSEIRCRYGVPNDTKLVLFFGTPRLHKGIDTLARAVSQIADVRFKLMIVGTAPDRSIYSVLDKLAKGRVIYLPNQPFSAIPEILAMADVVCLPQDEGHAISKFQLPAKAIDAVAMGVPLLVSNTLPLRQLVDDKVAELVNIDDIPAALERLAGREQDVEKWRSDVRDRFLGRYSYAAAAMQMHDMIKRCLSRGALRTGESYGRLQAVMGRALGQSLVSRSKSQNTGADIVIFWKQNDTRLYGRRHDMVIKYLASRPDIRKVIVFDAPISEHDLILRQQSRSEASQHRWIYTGTYEKLLGKYDTDKISYNVFAYPPGKYRNNDSDTQKPHVNEGYFPYVTEVLRREEVRPEESVFWMYPKNYSACDLIEHFKPAKVVVDVVDDHRAWPGISAEEYQRLTENYRETLAKADMAFVNCEPMVGAMSEFYPQIRLVPNGCDTSPPKTEPAHNAEFDSFKAWEGKTIGFVGNLEKKIDISLLEKIAQKFVDCQLVLIGSTHANPDVLQLKRYPNVRFAGVVPYQEVGAWVSKFDVGIIPHLNLEMTQHMNPLKLYVYLSWKVPVVSTEIFNIDRSAGLVRVADSHESFLANISDVLASNVDSSSDMIEYVSRNSWEARFEAHVSELISSMESGMSGALSVTLNASSVV